MSQLHFYALLLTPILLPAISVVALAAGTSTACVKSSIGGTAARLLVTCAMSGGARLAFACSLLITMHDQPVVVLS
jgi:hypothetical protein